MGKKVYGVLRTDSENEQSFCFIGKRSRDLDKALPVTKSKANKFVDKYSTLFPTCIYTVFKMKFKETI